jgi:hypothetical protein
MKALEERVRGYQSVVNIIDEQQLALGSYGIAEGLCAVLGHQAVSTTRNCVTVGFMSCVVWVGAGMGVESLVPGGHACQWRAGRGMA